MTGRSERLRIFHYLGGIYYEETTGYFICTYSYSISYRRTWFLAFADTDFSGQTITEQMGGGMNGGAPGGQVPSGMGGGFGGSGQVTQGDAASTISEDGTYSDETYTSTGDDENALRIDGASVTLDGITVDKSAGATSNTEDGDFYGMNAALLATDGAQVTISNAAVTSSAQNGNGVFSYGEGTVVNISDSTITTSADNSGGIQTTGGGTLTSNNGDMIYVTNTNCILQLSGVEIINQDEDSYLLNVSGNSGSHGWGSAGSNGAQVTFTASAQTLEGDIAVDSISTLDMTLADGSDFTGTINITENEQAQTDISDNAAVTIDEGCTWTLTGDCTLTSLTNNGTINYNGYTITLADGTVLS